jgi:hypothetical protein
MKQSLDLSVISKSLSHFFGRYHSILFFLVIGAGLMACLALIINTINLSNLTDPSMAQVENTTFDEDTMSRLKELDSAETSMNDFEKLFDQGRSNPFVE